MASLNGYELKVDGCRLEGKSGTGTETGMGEAEGRPSHRDLAPFLQQTRR